MDRLNYINSGNAAYINSLYEAYKQDPESIEFGWQKFFEGFDFGRETPAQAADRRRNSGTFFKRDQCAKHDQRLPHTRALVYQNKPCSRTPQIFPG